MEVHQLHSLMQTDFVKGFFQRHSAHTHTSFGGSINIHVELIFF